MICILKTYVKKCIEKDLILLYRMEQ